MKEKEVFFLFGYGCYVLAIAFLGNICPPLSRITKVFAIILLISGIIYDMRKIPIKEVWKNILILAIVGIVALKVDKKVGLFFMIIYAFRGCRFEKLLKCDFVIRITGFVFTNILCIIGLITDHTLVMYRASAGEVVTRHSMGYIHPNTCYLMLFVIIIDYILIRINSKKKINFFETSILTIVAYIYMELTDTRAGFILTVTFVLFMYIAQKLQFFEKCKKITKIMAFGTVICMGGSMLLIYIYRNSQSIGAALNKLLTSRVSSMNYYWTTYGPSIFGQRLMKVSTADALAASGRAYVLDNFYTNLLVGCGILFTILYCWLHIKTCLMLYKEKKYAYLVVFFFFAVYGIVEGVPMNIDYNFYMVMSVDILINSFSDVKCLDINRKEVLC